MQNVPKIKVCGITNFNDANEVFKSGADSLGFIFYNGSKRGITAEQAGGIIDSLRNSEKTALREFLSAKRNVIITGVFVNENPKRINAVVKDLNLDIIQLSGTESVNYIEELNLDRNKILKAVHIENEADIEEIYYYKDAGVNILLDTKGQEGSYGGTGMPFNLNILNGIDLTSIIIAGGIGPDNIGHIMKNVKPYGFDLSSKLEEYPGKKDYKRMKSFFDNFKEVLHEIS